MARPFFAYMLRCSDGSYYVEHTDELERRLAEHATGAGSGYTAARQPVRGKVSEDLLVEKWEGELERDIEKLIKYRAYKLP